MSLPPELNSSARRAWSWIPTLYFSEGIPYVIVMTVSVVMYKNLGVSNTAIALYTSWLYLPWVIKSLWSPLVERHRTKRFWIVALQFVLGAALGLVALTIPGPAFFKLSLAIFWLMAFSSATHDVAADGFYLLALPQHQQAAFVGVRSTFYRISIIAGQGGLVYLAGWLQGILGDTARAWSLVLAIAAVFFVLIGAYHAFALPRSAADRAVAGEADWWKSYLGVFAAFFSKPGIGTILGYLLLYRFAEAQLLKLVTPFLLDGLAEGGLALTTQQVGLIYGTVGAIALTVGGLSGGYAISRLGLRRMIWPMIILMHAPNLLFVFLAVAQPASPYVIGTVLAVEQLGYGFGFTAYLMYMMMVADGAHKTAHYALCTGFMALGMMLPGMGAGWVQDHLGYRNFFIWVCVASIPSFLATARLRIDPAFGKK